MVNKLIRFCLDNKLVTVLFALAVIAWGIMVAPFEWDMGGFVRDPVPVDAIPDIGENQQIVFTRWMGRSPQDIEDQVTYPLTVSLLGIPGVKTVRSFSMFGFSSIYVIFKEKVDFYWSRTRILEKLASLPPGTLPEEVKPTLGPDATALGQIFWYTLEGRDKDGKPTGGWDLQELRSIQDFYVRYGLMAADGVAEAASVGGYVKEYQIDLNPDAMRASNVTLEQVVMAAKMSNLDVGARTIEINSVEYVIRGVGFVKSTADLEKAVIRVKDNVPITIGEVAKVTLGPALRRGILDKEGGEAVGGVVVTRYGENPLAVIKRLNEKMGEIAPGLPEKVLPDGTVSKVTIVPFYDRTGLIRETLGTLNTAIYLEILVTIIVILIMLNNLGSSLIMSSVLPAAVLMCFIGMKLFHVDANIVSLSGIVIAIGTIVDMGIVLSENTLKHLAEAAPGENKTEVIYRAACEVGGAILTAVLTTIVGFLPVFTMQAAEGKLFKPLAFTKTFALTASIILALTVIPMLLQLAFGREKKEHGVLYKLLTSIIFILGGAVLMVKIAWWIGLIVIILGIRNIAQHWLSRNWIARIPVITNAIVVGVVGILLTSDWLPLGAQKSYVANLLFVVLSVGGLMLLFSIFIRFYSKILAYFLENKSHFLVPLFILLLTGVSVWLGFSKVFFFLPSALYKIPPVSALAQAFPGLGKEFMPPLDEGSYLYMPTTMTHASIGEVQDILRKQDMAITAIPEVESAVGKLGRVESPLDPAPISMIETIINIKSEYIVDNQGKRLRFKHNPKTNEFVRDEKGGLIPDIHGKPYRQWRDRIKKPDDIWNEIVAEARIIGVTSAPKLQPIAARIVMLQSGMRAPMGIKVHGPDLETIERFGMWLEKYLKDVPSVEAAAVYADRIVGKPYLEIEIDRDAIARYGVSIQQVQMVIEVALGGMGITNTIEGRERYTIRARYPRELRGLGSGVDDIKRILISSKDGSQIPLAQMANIVYRRGPQVIKSENTFLTGYVLFDMKPENAEVDVVHSAQQYLQDKIDSGDLIVPAGVSYVFAGSYENQVRSEKRLALVLPIALFAIFILLYFQFKKVSITALVFSGILVAGSGGFILIWLYGQSWFMDFNFFGVNMRDILQIHQINLSVAVWVGFLALFGIASDNGVIICTYLEQRFSRNAADSLEQIRRLTVEAGTRRVRPAMMTSATTILALLPVLTSSGRGADVMVSMAIPSFGGMVLQLVSLILVPVLYCMLKERKLRKDQTETIPRERF
ncbi:MAG: efflux RND transporter permease subunit [Chitinispirillaceae bacterium]|nr:efflux RND transporter permease subunit [Chitinispirillaceae bacterium]